MRIERRALVVEGALALGRARSQAAREGVIGRDIVTLPILAGRLAGGLIEPAPRPALYRAIQRQLRARPWPSLGPSLDLPGMPRAVLETLDQIWRNNFEPESEPTTSARLHDLQELEAAIESEIGPGLATPRRLRDLALSNVDLAPRLFSSIEVSGIVDVDPIWRPLLEALRMRVPVILSGVPDGIDRAWFAGPVERRPRAVPRTVSAEVCANPRSEVIEALRWARALLARDVRPSEIGIAATSTRPWDTHMLVLARDGCLPVHFSSGVPAITTDAGSVAASLAHILTSGVDRPNLHRLMRSSPFFDFPNAEAVWKLLAGHHAVSSPRQWQHVIEKSLLAGTISDAEANAINALLTILRGGTTQAAVAGEALLRGAALELWREALAAAPGDGIGYALAELRVAGDREPSDSISWSSAVQLANCPRPYVRLLGMTSAHWPRRSTPDPLLPDHVLPRSRWSSFSQSDRDRLHFAVIFDAAREELAMSRAQRGDQGTLLSRSPLWPPEKEVVLSRVRTPSSAFSEGDRLLARPREAALLPHIKATHMAWTNWKSPLLTGNDGQLTRIHPAIEAALTAASSPTSLQHMLSDPLGYILKDILGFKPTRLDGDPLRLDAASFGTIVHDLISGTIDAVSRERAYRSAPRTEIETALDKIAAAVVEDWPLDHDAPPYLLWRQAMVEARSQALRALLPDNEPLPAGSTTYSEVVFGIGGETENRGPLINAEVLATIVGTPLRFSGRIDRLDVSAAGAAVVTDYKTGAHPAKASRVVLGGGRELQRVLYAMAVHQFLPETTRVEARLHYLSGDGLMLTIDADSVAFASRQLAAYLAEVVAILRSGRIATRAWMPDAEPGTRLLFAADREAYLTRKRSAFETAGQPLRSLWRAQ